MKKALPIGTSNYRQLKSGGYYVIDKTLLIQEYLKKRSKVTLITRPRRFGKTSAMSMMSEFFDITKDSKDLFYNTNIMNTEYAREMNQYPTIFISFLNAKGDLDNVIRFVKKEILREYRRFKFVCTNLDEDLKTDFETMMKNLKATETNLRSVNDSLYLLILFLREYYGKNVMLFIDEYDTPFIEAHVNEFYEELHVDLASLLRTALKDNDSLQYAMLTGIQRVAKENIFSDLNNLKVYTMGNKEYAEYFGFTKEETKQLLEYYDLDYNDQVKSMYDGYRIGGLEIYNPWSIINYADEKELRPYWVNTSSNTMIKKAMAKSKDNSFQNEFELLIKQEVLETQVNMETSFYEQASTPSLWGLFVNAGYLTIEKEIDLANKKYQLRIPNNEVVSEFKDLVANHLHITTSELLSIYESFIENNENKFIQTYRDILLNLSSYHDLKDENSYHTLMLGICLYVKNEYELISNREEGKGRCDLILKAKKLGLPSYALEFKYTKNKRLNLCNLAKKAIDQIVEEAYDHSLEGTVIHVGLAHRGKDVEMIWKERDQ